MVEEAVRAAMRAFKLYGDLLEKQRREQAAWEAFEADEERMRSMTETMCFDWEWSSQNT